MYRLFNSSTSRNLEKTTTMLAVKSSSDASGSDSKDGDDRQLGSNTNINDSIVNTIKRYKSEYPVQVIDHSRCTGV